jgi:glyoxylate/hydroxypyruvate reductase A
MSQETAAAKRPSRRKRAEFADLCLFHERGFLAGTMNICVAVAGLDEAQRSRLRSTLAKHAVHFCAGLPEAEKRAAVAAAEIVFGNVPAAWLADAAKLRWVQLDSAGVDAYLKTNTVARAAPVMLTNLRGFFDHAVVEAVLAGVLAFYRQIPRLVHAQPEAHWIKTEVEPDIRALRGQRVVILGAGGIAQRLARVLEVFDAQVQLFSRTARPGVLSTAGELDTALGMADLLINTLPHTPETIGFLNRERLARLKRSAVVANAGRGSTLDENALLELIDRGHLAGAYLDVTAIEPLPAGSPLWRHPKVLLSQHTGGRFPGEIDRKLDVFLDNLARFERGEPLECRVDTARGY